MFCVAVSETVCCMPLVAAADRAMQLNQGWFLCNGHCGYVLQPDYIKQTSYSPFDKHTLINVDPVTITVTVSQLSSWASRIVGFIFFHHSFLHFLAGDRRRRSNLGLVVPFILYPAWGRGTPFRLCCSLVHSLPHLLLFITFSRFLFLIHFTYFPLLSIRSLSTRIVPLRFQARSRRRRLNLGLVCFVLLLCYLYCLVKIYAGVLLYLV